MQEIDDRVAALAGGGVTGWQIDIDIPVGRIAGKVSVQTLAVHGDLRKRADLGNRLGDQSSLPQNPEQAAPEEHSRAASLWQLAHDFPIFARACRTASKNTPEKWTTLRCCPV